MLGPEDVAKLQTEKVTLGCTILLIFPLLIIGVGLAVFVNLWLPAMAVYTLIALAIVAFYFFYRKKTNAEIDQDIITGRKNIIIAPIQDKRIASSEVKSGYRRGEIKSKYYMTIRGVEYPMNESDYLNIRVGEFLETHVAPLSKTVFLQKWLKEDGTSLTISED